MNVEMEPSQAAYDMVAQFESNQLIAYPDTGGIWTVGRGHTGTDVHEGMVITEDESDDLFDQDMAQASDGVNELVEPDLTQNQFDALVSFVFNLGVEKFENSTLLKLINSKSFAAAGEQFKFWVHGVVRGERVVLNGLVRRRAVEAALFEKPDYA